MTVAPLIAMKSTKCESPKARAAEAQRAARARDANRDDRPPQRSWRESEERLDGLRWQLKTSPESSRREVRG